MVALQARVQSKTELGFFLKRILRDNGVTYRQMEAASGISKSMIGDIANGSSVPDRDKVPDLADAIAKLTTIPVSPYMLEYLIQVDLWGKRILNNEGMVKHQELIDLVNSRRQILGEVEFFKRCQLNQIKPEELKAAQAGYIPSFEALGPISGLLGLPMDRLAEFVCTPESNEECVHR